MTNSDGRYPILDTGIGPIIPAVSVSDVDTSRYRAFLRRYLGLLITKNFKNEEHERLGTLKCALESAYYGVLGIGVLEYMRLRIKF